MAITNAQQYKQILQKMREAKAFGGVMGKDGRRAYVGGSYGGGGWSPGVGSSKSSPKSSNTSSIGGGGGGGRDASTTSFDKSLNPNRPGGPIGTDDSGAPPPTTIIGGEEYPVLVNDLENIKKRQEAEERAAAQREREKNEFITTDNTPSYVPSYLKFLSGNNSVNRKFFYDKVVAAGKIPGLNYGEDDLEQAYQDYMNNRMAGKTDAYGNPTQGFSYDIDETGKYDLTGNFIDDRDDGAGQQNLLDDTIEDKEDEEVINPRDYSGLAPRFMGSIFDFTGLAEGGRVAAQQGGIMSQQGGIMPRLNDLSGGVSSAEQMLQEINQRLDSAESTLGEGGGGGIFDMGQPQFNTNFNQQPLSPIAGSIPISGKPSYEDALSSYNQRVQSGRMTNDIEREKMRSRENYDSFNNNTYFQQVGLDPVGPRPPFNRMELQERFESMYPPGHPMRNFGIMRDGGRAGYNMGGMAEDDDPTGGIMDLESGRQMYFLGKLVKKAGRAIKKVVKSPIGKAALLYFGGKAFMGKMGGLGSLKGTLFGQAGSRVGQSFIPYKEGLLTKLGLTKGGGSLMPTFKGGMTLASVLPALFAGKDKDEDGPIDYGPGINIDRTRYAPYRTLAPSIIGSNYQTGTEGRKDGGRMGYQEGGDAEPVAKKTMPLLDMGGMEKDYRADGGFVPIGRMERADDVPARLSKNEFVFTADAVRNAGDGDIDKGAEVMYNMMKNLESGGEVSEESQGLDGAREMFQTSKRLEEVL